VKAPNEVVLKAMALLPQGTSRRQFCLSPGRTAEQFSLLAKNGATQALKIIEKLLSTETNPLG